MSFAKTNNWNKRREIQTPCHCTGWKKRTPAISWIWAKRKQQTEHKSTDPTKTDELSVCAVVLPYTSTVCATEKKNNEKRNKVYVSDGCECARRRLHSQCKLHSTKFQPMQVTHRAWQRRKKKERRCREGTGEMPPYFFPHSRNSLKFTTVLRTLIH